jgi:hypothetical protein
MGNIYQIYLKDSEEIISVDKRKMSIRDGCVHANGPKMGEIEQAALIIPLNSIKYIAEILTPDVNTSAVKEENIKMWKFGDLPPQA